MGLIIIINLHVSAPGSFVVVTAKENQHLWHHHQIKTFRDYSCGLSGVLVPKLLLSDVLVRS